MIPNLDFIRTMLEGIRESVFSRIASVASGLERKIRDVDERVQVPDYNAVMGDPGFIKNKPTLVGRPGEAEGAEVFNDYERNSATGSGSHAEGSVTSATGDFSHAEGANTQASGKTSHAEGLGTVASGIYSHAEGQLTRARGMSSHAEGSYTIAASLFQHVQGKYNLEDANKKYAHIVGNGESEEDRSNAHTLDWDGNAWFAGKVFVGGTGQDDPVAVELGAYEEWTFTLEDGSTVTKKVLVIG